jgi:hypothetical protein
MNVSLPEAEVRECCEQHHVSISVIEPLASGGTHLVCTTGAGAEEIRQKLAANVIAGPVRRFPFFNARGPVWPGAQHE